MKGQEHQQKITSKITFLTYYKYIEFFDHFTEENILGTTAYEIKSETIKSNSEDLWKISYFLARWH